jgi:hypothetical protein
MAGTLRNAGAMKLPGTAILISQAIADSLAPMAAAKSAARSTDACGVVSG